MELKVIDAFEVKENRNQKVYKVVSLFSGLGGMDLGFRGSFQFLNNEYAKNPFDIIFANDIFKQAADIYQLCAVKLRPSLQGRRYKAQVA